MFLPLFTLAFPILASALEPLVIRESRFEPQVQQPDTVTREDWEYGGERAELSLQKIPGISFSSSGGGGQTRSVFLRGARAEDTLVLLDGTPLNDPLSPSRAFDFSQVPSSDIERVEILKGPQGVLYGSDAMGGVVEFVSREPSDETHAKLEAGSYESVRIRASRLGMHGGYESAKGFSSADERQGNAERDAHKSWNLGGSKTFSWSEQSLLRVFAQYQNSTTDTDKNGGVGGDSLGTFTQNSQLVFRLENEKVLENLWLWKTNGSLFYRNRDDNTSGPSSFESRLIRLGSTLRRNFSEHTPTLGLELQDEMGKATEVQGRKNDQAAAIYLHNNWERGRWQASGGLRSDYAERFFYTWNLGLGYWIQPQIIRWKTNAGNGFKNPSLYQKYSTYGNAMLRPSRLLGLDSGFEFHLSDWRAEIAYYETRGRNLIDFDLVSSKYKNLGQTLTRGLELLLAKNQGRWQGSQSVTTIYAKNKISGAKLTRRPSYVLVTELSYQEKELWHASLSGRYVGRRLDVHPTTFTNQDMPGFFVANLSGSYSWAKNWKLQGRVENLLNRHYQETSGYGTPERSFYLGVETVL